MYARILVPLDGSPRAEAALPVAARLARVSGATLVLARIATVNPEVSPYVVVPLGSAPQVKLTYDTVDDAQAYLSRVREDASLREVSIETAVFVGMTAPALLAAIGETKSDLVVMCSHGRTSSARWALGSVTQHVARHAPVPVLVLRDSKPVPGVERADRPWPRQVLVPLDGSSLAEDALPQALALLALVGNDHRPELHLAHVVSLFEADSVGMPISAAASAARQYLDGVAARIGHGDFGGANAQMTIATHVVASQDVAGTLIRMAEGDESGDNDTSTHLPHAAPTAYDLMALATHGRSGVALWAVGSIAERVLQSTQLPLLIVRPTSIAKESAETVHKLAALHDQQKLEQEITSWPGLL